MRNLGERIRSVVDSSVITDAAVAMRVTVSLGAVSFPTATITDLDDLIRHADAAMYNAKKAGRNRLTFAGE